MIHANKVLEQALQSIPDPFVFCSNKKSWISKKQFIGDVEECRNHLRVLPKDVVVLGLENTYEFLVLYLSLLLEDFCVLFCGDKTWEEIGPILKSYEPGYVLLKHGDGVPSEYALKRILWDGVGLYELTTPRQDFVQNVETRVLLGTSGSTGSPKFVRLSLKNLISNAQSIAASLQVQPSDRAITCLPTSYSYGLSIVNSFLFAGGSLVLWDKGIMFPGFWELVKELDVTSLAGVPYSYQIMRRIGFAQMDLPKLKVMTQAGGKLALPLVKEFAKIASEKQIKFHVMYGQTEATARITCLPAEKLMEKMGSVGPAIPDGILSVRDPDENGIGDIVYSGPNVMLGYAEGRSDLFKGDELKGVLETGDIGYLDSDGFLYITGRKKRIAKIAGLRISLDEVEGLCASLGVVAAVSTDEKIVIYHTHTDENKLASEADQLTKKLKLHRSLLQLRYMEELPTNANGKLDYQTLQRLL